MTYIMVAPNGARRTADDHPKVPVTDQELITEARSCYRAGAHGLHAHIRDQSAAHLLDVSRYKALLTNLESEIPGLDVQITSEAAGIYDSESQIDLLTRIQAPWVSLALREVLRNQSVERLSNFFQDLLRKSRVQFILFEPTDLTTLVELRDQRILASDAYEVLYVLGRYTEGQVSHTSQLDSFLIARDCLPKSKRPATEMICAFGTAQIPCLVYAANHGLNLRIGFENGIWLPDGSVADDNASLVSVLINEIRLP